MPRPGRVILDWTAKGILVALVVIAALKLRDFSKDVRPEQAPVGQAGNRVRAGRSSDAETARAAVLDRWDGEADTNGRTSIGLLLEIRPRDRPAYQAQTAIVVAGRARPPLQVGDVIVVKLDPSDSSKVLVPLNQFSRDLSAWGGSFYE